jgi:ribose transport system ATP-binding protein
MPDLSVAENLNLGLPEKLQPSLSGLNDWARELLKHWSNDVSIDPREHVTMLNPEQRFIVEIVKALECKPKVLVFDEPTEHLAAEDVARLFERVRAVTARGASVVYISHRIREGQGTFDARELSEDQIVSLIVGGDLNRTFPPKAAPGHKPTVLATQDFSGPGFSQVSLQVRAGEILGLAGIDANGQREFMRALAGIYRSEGHVTLTGEDVSIRSSMGAKRLGISYVPEDRHREGIFPELTVRENFSIRSPHEDLRGGLISNRAEHRRTVEAIRQFAVKTPDGETPIQSLSGGNQQKVVLSSVLAAKPKVLLVDEPTQGVDVGARAEIYKVIRETAAAGVAVILVSSDQQEVAGIWNPFYVSPRSLTGMMTFAATLALVGYGQQILMLVRGIDLSVGPVMGLSQVVASFFLLSDLGAMSQLPGWILMIAVALVVGFVNWLLVEGLRMHPMVATLATFMAVQAISLILRPTPGGMIDGDIMMVLSAKVGISPVTFIAAVIVAFVLEYMLYRRRVGVSLRGLGSQQEAARTAGIHPKRVRLLAYMGCSFFAVLAAITMMGQIGIDDLRAGLSYTLGSIAAIVIGGASLFGGRGSFIGALLGAIFIVQVNSVTVFLRLSQEWQQYLLGFLILAAVALYSKSRMKVVQS